MSPLALALLRRGAALAVLIAALLLALPPVLKELGLLGPTVVEEIGEVERALEAARSFGATGQEPAYVASVQALDRARGLAKLTDRFRARRAIADARDHAIEAQRAALVKREEDRRQAQKLVAELDKLMNELDDRYDEAAKGADRETVSRLLATVKDARRQGAAVVLAYEQAQHAKVLQDAPAARAAIRAAREQMLAARRKS